MRASTSKFILVRVVNIIRVPQLPVATGRFCIFDRWTAGVGRFKDSTRLVEDVMKVRAPLPVILAPPPSRPSPNPVAEIKQA